MATITYSKVKLTRHSVKHGGKTKPANPARVLRSNGKNLSAGGTNVIGSLASSLELTLAEQQIEFHYVTLPEGGAIPRGYHLVEYVAFKKGRAVAKLSRKKRQVKTAIEKRPEDREHKDMFKKFSKLSDKAVTCSAKGAFNSGTKDSRVSCSINSIDVDFVSSRTGVVPLALKERKKDKKFYAKVFQKDSKIKPEYPAFCYE